MPAGLADTYIAYKFIKMLALSWKKTEAYKLGIIDDKGKFLKKVEDLDSQKEKKSVDVFNRLMINLKKIINKVPDPKLKAQLKTLPTAMILLKDEAEKYGADGEYVLSEVEDYLLENGINVYNLKINLDFDDLSEGEENDN